MAVLLHRSDDAPDKTAYRHWFAVASIPVGGLDPDTRVADIPGRLESVFESMTDSWLELARSLSGDSSASLSHTASAAANVSDFGVMLAWSRLVEEAAAGAGATLVVCDDPWMFRHLETLDNVSSGARPPLMMPSLGLGLRGLLARTKVALASLLAWTRMRGQRKQYPQGQAAILVYGHPASTVDGIDGYFGTLMRDMDELVRVLHVDCPAGRAANLAKDGRTFSLHAWGSPLDVLTLPLARWRPARAHLAGPFGWLIRRAAALEGGGGQGAMIAWQQRCQRRWLNHAKPKAVSWPWENHAWEKKFAAAAHRAGVHTIGYQHSVIGRHMLNYSPKANYDGADSLPRKIFCSGPSTLNQLIEFGMTQERLFIGGAFRFPDTGQRQYDPQGPVFIALPFDRKISAEMVTAARNLQDRGLRFVVKDHPMSPFEFKEAPGLVRTKDTLHQQGGLSTVLYAATTVGLEAYLGGLPTIRFLSEERMALDIMPREINLPTATSASLQETLSRVADQYGSERPTPQPGAHFFAAVSLELWRKELLNG